MIKETSQIYTLCVFNGWRQDVLAVFYTLNDAKEYTELHCGKELSWYRVLNSWHGNLDSRAYLINEFKMVNGGVYE